MKPLVVIEIDFNYIDVDAAGDFFKDVAESLQNEDVNLIAVPKGMEVYEASKEHRPIFIYKNKEYSVEEFVEVIEKWRKELQTKTSLE
jgi:hypothetical protein